MIRRGEIYFVFLDPVFGKEMGGYKTRPVVVVSVNGINDKPLTVTVAPGTSTEFSGAPNLVSVKPSSMNGLPNTTVFQCHQLRALDKGRFTSRPVGRLDPKDLDSVGRAIKFSLGLV